MKKHFLLLLLMTLLPLAGWATSADLTTKPTLASGLIYDGKEKDLVSGRFDLPADYDHAIGGVKWTYTTSSSTPESSVEGGELSSLKATNAGTYYVWYKVLADGTTKYNEASEWKALTTGGDFTRISKATIEFTTVPTGKTELVYTGEDQALLASGAEADLGNVIYSIDNWTTNITDFSEVKGQNAGSYTVKYKVAATDNYNEKEGELTVTIGAAELAAAFTTEPNLIYKGTAHDAPAVTVTGVNGAVLTVSTDYTVTASDDMTNAGAKTLTITGTGNYAGSTATLNFSIAPKSIVVTNEDGTTSLAEGFKVSGISTILANITFNGKAQKPAATLQENGSKLTQSASGDKDFTRTYSNNINASNEAVITYTGTNNYTGVYNLKFTIKPADISTISVNDISEQTYKAKSIEPELSNVKLGDYELQDTDYEVVYGENMNAGTNAGVVTIKAKEGGNFTGEDKVLKFNIAKASVTVKVKDNKKYYGDTDPAYELEYNSFLGSDTKDVITKEAEVERASGEDVGEYAYSITAVPEAANYTFTAAAEQGILTIQKASVFVRVADPAAVVYGYKLPELDKDAFAFTADGLKSGHTITGLKFTVKDKYGNEKSKDDLLPAGDYTITASDATVSGGDYDIDYSDATATLKVEKFQIKISAVAQNVAFGAEPKLVKNADKVDDEFTSWGNERIVIDNQNGTITQYSGHVAKSAFKALYGKWKEDFVESLAWEDYDGNVANPGFIVVKLKDDYDSDNFEVTTEKGAVTYTGIPTDLALDDSKNDNFTKITTFNGQTVDVKITFNRDQELPAGTNRTWTKECWNSLILPFEISVLDLCNAIGYSIFNVVDEEASATGNVAFKLEMGTANEGKIPANTPFLIKVSKDIANATTINFGSQKIVAPEEAKVEKAIGTTGYKFVGTYEAVTVNGETPDYHFWYGASQNPAHINAGASLSWTVAPFACYVDQTENTSVPASEMIFTYEDIDGNTTAIRGISTDNIGVKAYGEGWYNLNGVKLQGIPTEKGVYIQNGKKVVVK